MGDWAKTQRDGEIQYQNIYVHVVNKIRKPKLNMIQKAIKRKYKKLSNSSLIQASATVEAEGKAYIVLGQLTGIVNNIEAIDCTCYIFQ